MGRIITVDVRTDLRSGLKPLQKILAVFGTVEPEDEFRVIATFDPVPLHWLMKKKGYAYRSERTPEGDWQITYYRAEQKDLASVRPSASALKEAYQNLAKAVRGGREASNAGGESPRVAGGAAGDSPDAAGPEPPQPRQDA